MVDTMLLHAWSVIESERSAGGVFLRHFHGNRLTNFSKQTSKLGVPSSRMSFQTRNLTWKKSFALNTDGFTAVNEPGSINRDDTVLGGTRLGRIVGAGGRQLLTKLNSARKNFPMKVFLLLLGFYTANALATILGQTGDWDVLVAGVVVAAIEGIGVLMYRKPTSTGRLQSLVVMVNYWKAGVCLGLFVDAFKLGSLEFGVFYWVYFMYVTILYASVEAVARKMKFNLS